MRLYFGSYLRAPPLASWIPSRNSGTNFFGSFMNFFTSFASASVLLAPFGADRLEDHADRGGARVYRTDAPFARVSGPPAHREHALGVLGSRHGHVGSALDGSDAVVALERRVADRSLEAVGRGDEGVEQRLLAQRSSAAGHDSGDGGPEHRDGVFGLELRLVARRDTGAEEGSAPDGSTHAPDLADQRQADLLEDGSRAGVVELVVV